MQNLCIRMKANKIFSMFIINTFNWVNTLDNCFISTQSKIFYKRFLYCQSNLIIVAESKTPNFCGSLKETTYTS